MPDDLDLRELHARHEPDPVFRAALRQRVEAIVAGRSVATDETEPYEEDLIMLTDTRTDVHEAATRSRRWLLPAAAAAIVALVAAVAVTTRDDGGDSTTLNSPVVFNDDFSDDSGAWETLDVVHVEAGQQVWNITNPGLVEFLKPLPSVPRVADMEVTADVASVDPDSIVGLYCRKGIGNQDAYYYFRLAPQGAVIGVLPTESAAPARVLAENPGVTRPTGPFQLTARCIDNAGVAQLTFLLDGEVIAETTHDSPLPPGWGALEVQAGAPGSADSEVRFDEFTVSAGSS